jgi:hypothetical protein
MMAGASVSWGGVIVIDSTIPSEGGVTVGSSPPANGIENPQASMGKVRSNSMRSRADKRRLFDDRNKLFMESAFTFYFVWSILAN